MSRCAFMLRVPFLLLHLNLGFISLSLASPSDARPILETLHYELQSDYFETLWASLDWAAEPVASNPFAENPFTGNSCFDGIDNDYDGLIDHADPGCWMPRQ